MKTLIIFFSLIYSFAAFGQGSNQISFPEAAQNAGQGMSDTVFAESTVYSATDSLSHTAVRSYFTRESLRPRNFRLARYGVGAELHNGTATDLEYRGTKGVGFAVARLAKNLFVDAAAGANTIETRNTASTLPVLATGVWFAPTQASSVSLRAWQDSLYFEWLDYGATDRLLFGKNFGAYTHWDLTSDLVARAGSTVTDVSDGNLQTSTYANLLYKFRPKAMTIGLGPSVSQVTFSEQQVAYWSPARWSWIGALTEVSIPFTRSLAGEAKWSFGPAYIKNEKSKLFSSGEVRLKMNFTKTFSANLAYLLTSSNNSAEKWNRSAVGASLTAGL